MKVGIGSDDCPDPVFVHERRSMSIMPEISPHLERFEQKFLDKLGVVFLFGEQGKSRGCQNGLQEFPGIERRKGVFENGRMGADPQELVENSPSTVPGGDGASPFLNHLSCQGMIPRFLDRRVEKDVGVNDQHRYFFSMRR